ncbi:MAG: FtsW/RodA/SpoVE family cell cycle protein, partial [Desulfobacterales bacterium]|nr:FtsW/RodA/SpoVE family cell cycle protein [Desulfobacterales bacterium]
CTSFSYVLLRLNRRLQTESTAPRSGRSSWSAKRPTRSRPRSAASCPVDRVSGLPRGRPDGLRPGRTRRRRPAGPGLHELGHVPGLRGARPDLQAGGPPPRRGPAEEREPADERAQPPRIRRPASRGHRRPGRARHLLRLQRLELHGQPEIRPVPPLHGPADPRGAGRTRRHRLPRLGQEGLLPRARLRLRPPRPDGPAPGLLPGHAVRGQHHTAGSSCPASASSPRSWPRSASSCSWPRSSRAGRTAVNDKKNAGRARGRARRRRRASSCSSPTSAPRSCLAALAAMVLFIGGVKLRYLAAAGPLAGALFGVYLVQADYRVDRIQGFLAADKDALGSGYQVAQSKLALGSGGFVGAGLGRSTQKLNFLPFNHTDFIFAILGEETGLVGTIVTLGLYLFFLWRGLKIALEAPTPAYKMIAAGITLAIVAQALMNMSIVLGLGPAKGTPCPSCPTAGPPSSARWAPWASCSTSARSRADTGGTVRI